MTINSDNLAKRKCVPCETGEGKLEIEQIKQFLPAVPDWMLIGDSIVKEYKFKNFVEAMRFVNKVADIAEEEGHHPDFFISWNKVKLILSTHVAHGLTENDFILAAKINRFKI